MDADYSSVLFACSGAVLWFVCLFGLRCLFLGSVFVFLLFWLNGLKLISCCCRMWIDRPSGSLIGGSCKMTMTMRMMMTTMMDDGRWTMGDGRWTIDAEG